MTFQPFTADIDQRILDAMELVAEKELLLNYRTALDSIKADLLALVEQYGTNGVLTNAQATQYGRLDNLYSQIAGEIEKLTGKVQPRIEGLITDTLDRSYSMSMEGMEEGIGVKLQWGQLNTSIAEAISHPLFAIGIEDIKKTLLIDIQRTIAQGLIRGESYFTMAKGIKSACEMSATRAIRIARTEAGRAQALGQLQSYDDAEAQGVQLVKEWLSAIDNRTRPDHVRMNGKKANKKGLFTLPGGITAPGPHLTGYAKHDCNCRCRLIAVVNGYEPQAA